MSLTSPGDSPVQLTQLTQLTPAQRRFNTDVESDQESDNSQTCLKQIYRSNDVNDASLVTTPVACSQFDNTQCESPPTDSNWALIDRVQALYRGNTQPAFISHILGDTASNYSELNDIRHMLYELCKKSKNFPFPPKSDLKRRKKTRGADKLASDIYTIISVMDNRNYDDLRDIISVPRSQSNDLNASVVDQQLNTYKNELKLLQDSLLKCQSDIILVKQEKRDMKKAFDAEIKSIRLDMLRMRQETGEHLHVIMTDIQRIDDEKSSGVTSLKNSLKLVTSDIAQCKDSSNNGIQELKDTFLSVNRKIDKQYGKLESKIIDLNNTILKKYTVPSDNDKVKTSTTSTYNTYTQNNENDRSPSRVALTDAAGTVDKTSSSSVSQHEIHATEINRSASNTVNMDSGSASHVPSGQIAVPVIVTRDRESRVSTDDQNKNNKPSDPIPNVSNKSSPKKQTIPVRISDTRSAKVPGNSRSMERANQDPQIEDDTDFTEYVARRSKRFYVGGFKNSITVPKLRIYTKNRHVKATMVRIFPQQYGRRVIIRLNVDSPDAHKVTESGFWPPGVTCRPWMSKSAYVKKFHSSNNDNDDELNDDLSNDVYTKHSRTDNTYRHRNYDRQNYGNKSDSGRGRRRHGDWARHDVTEYDYAVDTHNRYSAAGDGHGNGDYDQQPLNEGFQTNQNV